MQRVNDDSKAANKEVVSAVQAADKIQQLTREVKALKAKGRSKKKCSTCVRGYHEPGKCYAVNLECHECHKKGHIKGASVCSKDGAKKKVQKVRAGPSDSESEHLGELKYRLDRCLTGRTGRMSMQTWSYVLWTMVVKVKK